MHFRALYTYFFKNYPYESHIFIKNQQHKTINELFPNKKSQKNNKKFDFLELLRDYSCKFSKRSIIFATRGCLTTSHFSKLITSTSFKFFNIDDDIFKPDFLLFGKSI